MAKPGTVLAIDQGTTSSRAIVFDADLGVLRARAARVRPALSGLGWVEHDPEDIWRTTVATARAGAGRRQAGRRATSPPSASPTSARPASSGTGAPAGRSTAPSSGRTGARRSACRSLKRAGPRAGRHRQDRPAARSLFLGHQDRLAARPRGGRARARQGGAPGLRHDRQLPDLAPHRRQGARDRRHQRLAHAALRHRQGRLGRRSARAVRRAALDAARGARLQCRLRRDRAVDPRRRHPHPRRRRRPAGGDHRPGLLRARHGQGHLRHRLLRAAQHRGRSRSPRTIGC